MYFLFWQSYSGMKSPCFATQESDGPSTTVSKETAPSLNLSRNEDRDGTMVVNESGDNDAVIKSMYRHMRDALTLSNKVIESYQRRIRKHEHLLRKQEREIRSMENANRELIHFIRENFHHQSNQYQELQSQLNLFTNEQFESYQPSKDTAHSEETSDKLTSPTITQETERSFSSFDEDGFPLEDDASASDCTNDTERISTTLNYEDSDGNNVQDNLDIQEELKELRTGLLEESNNVQDNLDIQEELKELRTGLLEESNAIIETQAVEALSYDMASDAVQETYEDPDTQETEMYGHGDVLLYTREPKLESTPTTIPGQEAGASDSPGSHIVPLSPSRDTSRPNLSEDTSRRRPRVTFAEDSGTQTMGNEVLSSASTRVLRLLNKRTYTTPTVTTRVSCETPSR